MDETRVVFMGSPDFAIPTLKALAEKYTIVGVVTQPDRPAGRKRELKSPPVKELAQELGLPFIQPAHLKDAEALQQLQAWAPDLIVVAAFGQILRQVVLDIPTHGCLNVHASLLPRWRGAAPINAAILHGDEVSGVTIMKMDTGLDTGPMLSKSEIHLSPDETGGSLSSKLSIMGGKLLIDTLPAYIGGELVPQPQDDSQSTYVKMLKRTDGELDFSKPAISLERMVRAYSPWPGTYMLWGNQRLKIHKVRVDSATSPGVGVFSIQEGYPAVGTSDGLLILDKVQPAGKRTMPGELFLRGARDWISTQ